ncbi:ATP-binding protein [Clostridiales bacterium COT073_COT-073]|nr:ATP-binding protein [Clostridiales bacterium COT073_COT-073]
MLVQFTLKNFLSFKNEATLDMTAISAYKEHEYNLMETPGGDKLVKVAAIYGANASGKSNLRTAMEVFQKIILESFHNVRRQEEQAIYKYYFPFEFHDQKENTEFEIVVITDVAEYRYGFEYNPQEIVSEWFYQRKNSTKRLSVLFERSGTKIEFGAMLRKECDIYKNQIPAETLVLSFFNKLRLKTEVFTNVFQEIFKTWVSTTDTFEKTHFLEQYLPETIDRDKKSLLKFLSAIDSGIKDIYYETDGKKIKLYTVHKKDEKIYPIHLHRESEGTAKSIAIFIWVKKAILAGSSMFVDELNTKLHPLLLKFIIDLFYERNSKAQLIYTTHDTTLLNKKFFRRDQIWFVQKEKDGCSRLEALSDFKVRSDASFEKDYLAGVYGAIPRLKAFEIVEEE